MVHRLPQRESPTQRGMSKYLPPLKGGKYVGHPRQPCGVLGQSSQAQPHSGSGTNQTASDLQEDFILLTVVCGWLGNNSFSFIFVQAQSGLSRNSTPVPVPCLPHPIPFKSLIWLGSLDWLDWTVIHADVLPPKLPQMIDMLLLLPAPSLPCLVPHNLIYFCSEFLNILSCSVSALRNL